MPALFRLRSALACSVSGAVAGAGLRALPRTATARARTPRGPCPVPRAPGPFRVGEFRSAYEVRYDVRV